jgi:hypothetical protein
MHPLEKLNSRQCREDHKGEEAEAFDLLYPNKKMAGIEKSADTFIPRRSQPLIFLRKGAQRMHGEVDCI